MGQSNIPSDDLQPQSAMTLDFESGPIGLVTIGRAIALVGAKAAGGSAALEVPTQVFSGAEGDAAVGQGTPLALMVRMVFRVFKLLGGGAEVFVVPIAEATGVQATRTFTATGTATEAGDLELKIAGRLVRVPVPSGAVVATVASAIKTACDAMVADLPGTATAALGVCTFTAVLNGVNGNDIAVEVVKNIPGVTVVAANGVTGTGVIDITNALDSLEAEDYQSLAITNHLAADLADLAAHLTATWAATAKRYRHAFVGETGTLGTATTLASGSDRNSTVMVTVEGAGSLPGEIAAAVAAMRLTKDKPNYNYDGTELPIYPPNDTLKYGDSEVKTALRGGATPLTKLKNGMMKMERLVTTQTTDSSGNPFDAGRDLSNSATAGFYAKQISIAHARALKGKDMDTELLKDLSDITFSILKIGEGLNHLHNVDAHKGEIGAVVHPSDPGRALTEIPLAVMPNAHQVDGTMRVIVEGAQ